MDSPTELATREVQVDLGYRPRAHQLAVERELADKRFQVRIWHRRGGKTLDSIARTVVRGLKNKRPNPPPLYMFVSPELKQGKRNAWPYLKAFARRIHGSQVLEGETSIVLPNGARISVVGAADPDSLRGPYLDGVVLDEIADMPVDTWNAVLRPALMDYKGWATFIGTPKGMNALSDMYTRAKNGTLGSDWGTSLLRWDQTDMLDADEVESARRDMTPAMFAQELECDFAASADDRLIPLDDVLRAQEREYNPADFSTREKVMGVDVARRPGGDRSVICMRQGPVVFKLWKAQGLSLMLLADEVARRIAKWKPDACFVDAGGMGQGVVDRLQQLGHNDVVMPVDFGERASDRVHFQNKRVEMWWRMSQAVKREAWLPRDDDLRRDLTAPKFDYMGATDRLSLESKDELRKRGEKSPDCGDAYALTYSSPVAIRSPEERAAEALAAVRDASRGSARRTRFEYDPLEGF